MAAKIIKDEEKALQLSRLRMAWQSADKVMSTADSVLSQSNQDEPLPESVRQMLDQRWKARYGELVLVPRMVPETPKHHPQLGQDEDSVGRAVHGGQLSLGAATLTLGEAAQASTTPFPSGACWIFT